VLRLRLNLGLEGERGARLWRRAMTGVTRV